MRILKVEPHHLQYHLSRPFIHDHCFFFFFFAKSNNLLYLFLECLGQGMYSKAGEIKELFTN
jgi:hypothetical protein